MQRFLQQLTEGGCDLLAALQADPDGVSGTNSNIIIWTPSGPEHDCKSWDGKEDWNVYANNKKYRWDTSYRFYPWGTSIKGKVKSYKKKNGNWKKWRTDLVVQIYGVHYDYECKVNAPYNKPKHKRRKKLKEIIFWGGQKHQYKSGDPHCYFSVSSGSNTETL